MGYNLDKTLYKKNLNYKWFAQKINNQIQKKNTRIYIALHKKKAYEGHFCEQARQEKNYPNTHLLMLQTPVLNILGLSIPVWP